MHTTKFLVRISTTLVCAAGIANAAYNLVDTYDKKNFFTTWKFITVADPTLSGDPTNGFVKYVDSGPANKTSLAGFAGDQIYMGVDSATAIAAAPGRNSVRLESNKQYNKGLFIADIAHMPDSQCGIWPAWWTYGDNWPNNGEIDILEGVNLFSTNAVTLHTGPQCTVTVGKNVAGSNLAQGNCNLDDGKTGCSTKTTAPFGTAFNTAGGGVYATEWTSTYINIWFWPRASIPADIKSGKPDPTTWGQPLAGFNGGPGTGCVIDDNFKNHKLVFNITFCGDWAGRVFDDPAAPGAPSCAAMTPAATGAGPHCAAYVGANGKAFDNAYWLINSVTVFQAS